MNETSQTAVIYERLREGILSLSMTPGERLTERGLETALEASRTPVRAALVRLESEGLVQRDGRGWIVAPIDLAEVQQLLELREIIESAAARLACERAPDAALDMLERSLSLLQPAGPGEEGLRSGTTFHVDLVRLSENPFLVASTLNSMTRLARTRWLEVQTPESRALAAEEHRVVVAALRRRGADPVAAADDAAAAVVAHIRNTRDRLLASLDADRRLLRARGYAIR